MLPDEGHKLSKLLLAYYDDLRTEHQEWWTTWQNLYDLSKRNNVNVSTGETSVTKAPRLRTYDTTVVKASQDMADGFTGLVTPPSSPWLGLMPQNPKLIELDGVRDWLEACQQTMYQAMERSNFYAASNSFYYDFGLMMNACVYSEERDDNSRRLHHKILGIHEIIIDESDQGFPNAFFRPFKLKLHKAVKRFGSALPEDMVEVAQKGENLKAINTELEFLHCVLRRDSGIFGTMPLYENIDRFPVVGFYLLCSGASTYAAASKYESKIVSCSGYEDSPYNVARWSTRSGEKYGWGPGGIELDDIKMLNVAKKSMARFAHLSLEPPIGISGLAAGRVDRGPNAMNFAVDNEEIQVVPLNPTGQYPFAADEVRQLEKNVRDAFFADVFLLMTNAQKNQKTQLEVQSLLGEQAQKLSSVIGRITSEFLEPVLNRIFNLELQAGRMPKAPVSLRPFLPDPDGDGETVTPSAQNPGGEVLRLMFDYVGPLAMAQRRSLNTGGILRGLQDGAILSTSFPEVLDNIKKDPTYRSILQNSGFPLNLIETPLMVENARKARAQQIQEQQALAKAQQQAETFDKLNQTVQTGSPAESAIKTMQQAAGQPQPSE